MISQLFTVKLLEAFANGECILLTKGITEFPISSGQRLTGNIDIWWIMRDGGILMLTAHLLKQHKICILHPFISRNYLEKMFKYGLLIALSVGGQ